MCVCVCVCVRVRVQSILKRIVGLQFSPVSIDSSCSSYSTCVFIDKSSVYLGWETVALLERSPHFRCVLIEMGSQKSTFLGSSVSDPLRPLWPALGIIASFIVTFLFISGGALVDRLRGKQGEDDDDGE